MSKPFLLFAVSVGCCFAQKDAVSKGKDKDPQTSQETRIAGKLIDADCYTNPKCRVGAGSAHFGLMLDDGTFLKFDEGGNAKVLESLKSDAKGRKLLHARPGAAKRIRVSVSGTRTADIYNLESIRY